MCVEAHCTVCDANLTCDGDCLVCEERMMMEDFAAEEDGELPELPAEYDEYCPADYGDLGYYEEDQPEWMS